MLSVKIILLGYFHSYINKVIPHIILIHLYDTRSLVTSTNELVFNISDSQGSFSKPIDDGYLWHVLVKCDGHAVKLAVYSELILLWQLNM
jgi:hypothetical protein